MADMQKRYARTGLISALGRRRCSERHSKEAAAKTGEELGQKLENETETSETEFEAQELDCKHERETETIEKKQ